MTDWVGISTILGTIVLALILIQQTYATWQDQRQKRLGEEREAANRPRFESTGVFLHQHPLILLEKLGNDANQIGKTPRTKKLKVSILKVKVKNVGKLNAKRAWPHLLLGKPKLGDELDSVVWGPVIQPQAPDVISIPSWSWDALETMDEENIAEMLRMKYFGQERYGFPARSDMAPSIIGAVSILFSLEEGKTTHIPTIDRNSRQLPLESDVYLNISMDDVIPSFLPVCKLTLSKWDTFSTQPLGSG